MDWDEARRRALGAVAFVSGCRVLGGHGLPMRRGATCDLIFTPDGLELRGLDEESPVVPYQDITAIEIGGPGKTRSGGAFIGGGFGPAGAAEGMLIAAALNMLTTRSKIKTVICIQTATAELFLHNDAETPDALRIRLSPVFTKLRQQHAARSGSSGPTGGSRDDLAGQIAKLADLHDRGALTDEQFEGAKARLLE
jgi:hypothetical protein